MKYLAYLHGILIAISFMSVAQGQEYTMGILPQRSAQLTAEYWNPILEYISKKSEITLTMGTTRTGTESRDKVTRGDYDFVYTNHLFQPKVAVAGYRVILRPNAADFTSEIVTLQDSPIQSLTELNGQVVGFASKAAFVGYWVPMDQLLRQKIAVTPVFGGNQEGIIAQLKSGRVAAVGVNGRSMESYAKRENLTYRRLWTSASFHEIPIAAHPRVSAIVVEAVRNAFENMPNDPEGMAILEQSAKVINEKPPFGFKKATQTDYQDQIDFYTHTLVTESN